MDSEDEKVFLEDNKKMIEEKIESFAEEVPKLQNHLVKVIDLNDTLT